jgi:beta-lactam-binding protein with PASTA domain
VPQVAALTAGEVDKVLAKASLVAILRYEPGVVTNAGTVVATEPPAGTMVWPGDIVTVIVAGAPARRWANTLWRIVRRISAWRPTPTACS